MPEAPGAARLPAKNAADQELLEGGEREGLPVGMAQEGREELDPASGRRRVEGKAARRSLREVVEVPLPSAADQVPRQDLARDDGPRVGRYRVLRCGASS